MDGTRYHLFNVPAKHETTRLPVEEQWVQLLCPKVCTDSANKGKCSAIVCADWYK